MAARAAQWTVARRKSCHHQREHRPCCTPEKKTKGPLKPHQQSGWLTGLLSSSTSSWWVIPSHLEKICSSNRVIYACTHFFGGSTKLPTNLWNHLKPPADMVVSLNFFVPPSVANSLLNHGTFLSFTWPTCHKLTLGGSFSCGKKQKKRPGVKLVFFDLDLYPLKPPRMPLSRAQMEVEAGIARLRLGFPTPKQCFMSSWWLTKKSASWGQKG